MTHEQYQKIINDIGHTRIGGTAEEKATAEYLVKLCNEMGIDAHVESFEIDHYEVKEAHLYANGEEIPCVGYMGSGSGTVEAPLVYCPDFTPETLAFVKDKIVLLDTGIRYFDYQDLVAAGAVGFITYNGDVKWADEDIEPRELRKATIGESKAILGANINAKYVHKIADELPMMKIVIEQTEGKTLSYNAVAEIPGQTDEILNLCAHLDSVEHSQGVWDNLTGCLAVLTELEALKATAPNKCTIKAVFTGSEEKGLLGAKAYVEAHKDELEKTSLNLNVDMIGTPLGRMGVHCTATEAAVHYMGCFAKEEGVNVNSTLSIWSSDGSVFGDNGVPSFQFARMSPRNVATLHCRYDDASEVSLSKIKDDCDFIAKFAVKCANAKLCPVPKKIAESVQKDLDAYFNRKRKDA